MSGHQMPLCCPVCRCLYTLVPLTMSPYTDTGVPGIKQSCMLQVRYQVTPEGVQQIFAEKPHVHRAFLANVPASMDENAFWTRFFKNELNRQVSCDFPCCPQHSPSDQCIALSKHGQLKYLARSRFYLLIPRPALPCSTSGCVESDIAYCAEHPSATLASCSLSC